MSAFDGVYDPAIHTPKFFYRQGKIDALEVIEKGVLAARSIKEAREIVAMILDRVRAESAEPLQ